MTGASALTILLLFFIAIACMAFVFFLGWWVARQKDSLSPYSGAPLRRGETLSYYAKEQILRFVYEHQDYDNQLFKLNKAAYCRETGRIFPNAISWYDTVRVDWSFLKKRHKGHYVSWGSLTEKQKEYIRRHHPPLKGFQTTFSSSRPSPRELEPEYAFAKPGPLYVDVNTMNLLGWQCVPYTDFEVLIFQKPTKIITLNIDQIEKTVSPIHK